MYKINEALEKDLPGGLLKLRNAKLLDIKILQPPIRTLTCANRALQYLNAQKFRVTQFLKKSFLQYQTKIKLRTSV